MPPALNFGPDPGEACTVATLVERLQRRASAASRGGAPRPAAALPETAALRLDASLAHDALGWTPRLGLDEALRWTADWYRAQAAGGDARALTLGQIEAYEGLA